MEPQVLEKKIALLFTYRKIVIIFKSFELEHTPSNFPQSKRWSATVQSQKNKKGSSRRIYSCFFTHNGITTPKTTREGPESTTKTSLHLAWPPKFKNQVLFTPRAQNRFLDLGLLPRGCRPKSRSLPGRVEVIHPVVRACTTFWLTSTRITLTRVHRMCDRHRDRAHRSLRDPRSCMARKRKGRDRQGAWPGVFEHRTRSRSTLTSTFSSYSSVGYWFACPVIFLSFLYCCWALLFARKLCPAHAPG